MSKNSTFRADVLVEALPYIKKFWNKIVVVKYGGSAMEDKQLEKSIIKDIILLRYIGMKPVIVHGGGPEITQEMNKQHKTPQFIEGLRVTDKDTMEITEMVLTGKINTRLVAEVNLCIAEDQGNGIKGIGLSGEDAQLLMVKKFDSLDLGYVGEIEQINTEIITLLLEKDYLPIIATIGVDNYGERYNINADTAAGELAGALKAEKLIYLTDVDGIFRKLADAGSLISSLNLEETQQLLTSGQIQKGMIPKLKSAQRALEGGVKKVHFLNGKRPHSILLEILTDSGIGTEFVISKDED